MNEKEHVGSQSQALDCTMTASVEAQRLDVVLVRRQLARSRMHARDLILAGAVVVAGTKAGKPGQRVHPGDAISIADLGTHYVSRGAEKLAAGLDAFGFNTRGRIALDVGASTGGFTQVLLERGATRVYAVDVGHDQLHPTLRHHERVQCLEGTDARDLTREDIPDAIQAAAVDVSFISLIKTLPAVLALLAPEAWLVALVKPQFEAGRAAVGKGGIVRDPELRERAVEAVRVWLESQPGWRIAGSVPSPILGRSGNQEYLLGAVNEG